MYLHKICNVDILSLASWMGDTINGTVKKLVEHVTKVHVLLHYIILNIYLIPSHSSRSSVEQPNIQKNSKNIHVIFFSFDFSFVQSWNHTTKSTFCSKIFRISISHSLFCCFRINKFNPTITI